jgi:hypothetical protein
VRDKGEKTLALHLIHYPVNYSPPCRKVELSDTNVDVVIWQVKIRVYCGTIYILGAISM